MAIGDHILEIRSVFSRITSGATESFLFGTNGDITFRLFSFPDGSTTYAIVNGVMSSRYAGGGLDIIIPWRGGIGSSNNVRLQAEFARWAHGDDFLVDPTFDSVVGVTAAVPSTNGLLNLTKLSMAAGDLDGIRREEGFTVRISRNPGHADDNWTAAIVMPLDDLLQGVET